MRLNAQPRHQAFTHEGGPAYPHINPVQRLRRLVMSCLLWEDQFYVDGKTIADQIVEAACAVSAETLAAIAVEARSVHNLRHVPLLLVDCLAKAAPGNPIVADTIDKVVQRADEMAELLAVYWRSGRRPVAAQIKKGLGRAFRRFDAYALAKYDRDGAVKLRDVLRIVHPKPENAEQAALWRKVIDRALESPDTWEVVLSGGADKREAFERLLREGKLGYLALLRNLRNMATAGVDTGLVRDAIIARKGAHRVLPFRYVAAARAAPQFEPAIDQALCEAIAEMPPLTGRTAILVDVSGSMDAQLSAKSDLKRLDAAAALASVPPSNDLRVFTFSETVVEVPPRRGMAGVDAIVKSQPHGGTYLGIAVDALNRKVQHDRLIVITDEQSHDRVPPPIAKRAYMINVASNQHGVGYGPWTHIDGFSEGVIRFIREIESDA